MNEARGECIACADGVSYFNAKARHLGKLPVFQN